MTILRPPPKTRQIGGPSSLIFQLQWEVNNGIVMTLNFVPLVTELKLKPPYVLSHFQAMPYAYRNFGWVDVVQGRARYTTIPYQHIDVKAVGLPFMLDESKYENLRPTAIMYYPSSTLSTSKGKWILK